MTARNTLGDDRARADHPARFDATIAAACAICPLPLEAHRSELGLGDDDDDDNPVNDSKGNRMSVSLTHRHKPDPAATDTFLDRSGARYNGARYHDGVDRRNCGSTHIVTDVCRCGAMRFSSSSRDCPVRWLTQDALDA